MRMKRKRKRRSYLSLCSTMQITSIDVLSAPMRFATACVSSVENSIRMKCVFQSILVLELDTLDLRALISYLPPHE